MGAAAALANLDILEREGLLQRAAQVGPAFQANLRATLGGHPLVGDVRGEALIAGVELMADPVARRPFPAEQKVGARLHELCLDEGLVVRALGDTLAFSPPLCIAEDELAEAVRRFHRGLERLESELRA